MNVSQFDNFVNRATLEMLGAQDITQEDLVPMISSNIPAKLVELNITKNGTYYPETGIDGFYKVVANINPNLHELTVTENGIYTPGQLYDGFSIVNVETKQGLDTPGFKALSLECKPNGNDLYATLVKSTIGNGNNPYFPTTFTPIISATDFLNAAKSDSFLSCILEQYVYGTYATLYNAELIGDFHSGGATTNNVLTKPITDYSIIILQGIYNNQTQSQYNRSDFYSDIKLNTQYNAGMIDRNGTYNCGITFTDSTHCNLSGNKQCMIYGII